MASQVITDSYCLYRGDSCRILPQLPAESVGLAIFSPPFADLFSYSDATEDMGNCKDYVDFFKHFGFLVRQLQRLLLPGRVVAVHCMELPTFKRSGEEIGLRDFPGDIIRCFQDEQFIFHSRFVIWKDPLIAAVRTKAIGLAHKQIVKDSSMCRTSIADYILAFRKKGVNPIPVRHEAGLTTYHGSRPVPHSLNGYIDSEDQGKNRRSQWIWQQYASPVWMDIRQTKVLSFRQARDNDDEKHICPLAVDTVNRCLELWSTKGDVVLDPFGGVGTTPYLAVKQGRKGLAVELKPSYFRQMALNLETLMRKQKASSMLEQV